VNIDGAVKSCLALTLCASLYR